MLPTVTPATGEKVVLADPISIKLYWYPIGIATDEFNGIDKVIGEEALRRMVLLASTNSSVNPETFVIIDVECPT